MLNLWRGGLREKLRAGRFVIEAQRGLDAPKSLVERELLLLRLLPVLHLQRQLPLFQVFRLPVLKEVRQTVA